MKQPVSGKQLGGSRVHTGRGEGADHVAEADHRASSQPAKPSVDRELPLSSAARLTHAGQALLEALRLGAVTPGLAAGWLRPSFTRAQPKRTRQTNGLLSSAGGESGSFLALYSHRNGHLTEADGRGSPSARCKNEGQDPLGSCTACRTDASWPFPGKHPKECGRSQERKRRATSDALTL
jgi:hypothetical protein